MCTDWPCVTACAPHALQLPDVCENESPSLPHMAVAWINTDKCLPYNGPECGACASSCPVPGALEWELEKPRINLDECTGCAQCREACIVEPKAIGVKSIYKTRTAEESIA